MTQAVNARQYELLFSELLAKGVSKPVAQLMSYEILILCNATGNSYRSILDSISKKGFDFDKSVIDQLNLFRTSGNVLGADIVKKTPYLISRELSPPEPTTAPTHCEVIISAINVVPTPTPAPHCEVVISAINVVPTPTPAPCETNIREINVEQVLKPAMTGTKILSVDTVYISFDPLPVGDPSPYIMPEPLSEVWTIELKNLGTAPLTINAADGFTTHYFSFDMYPIYHNRQNGEYFGPNGNSYWTGEPALSSAIIIPPGGRFTFDVYWYATANYQYPNAIIYKSDADNGVQITYVDINYTREFKALILTPLNLHYSFREQQQDNMPLPKTLEIRNGGNTTVTVFDIVVTGSDNALVPILDYTGLGGSSSTTIAPYDSKFFTLAYSSNIPEGNYTSTIEIISDSDWWPQITNVTIEVLNIG